MSSLVKKRSLFSIAILLTGTIGLNPVQAQPIVPATDGTGTVVAPSSNTFNITGGSISADKANLFHSFSEFGLNSGQIANFLSNPLIKNILSRVVGGTPSIINGTLQVTGGNSNLFLMNPAGIVFGKNASLNVPAAFTATTATSVGFGNNWFNATGTNNYDTLIGTPSTFAFSTSGTPGAIANAGKLSVREQQNLTLIGGTVLNTGTLTAPQGNITVAAVPGSSLVRITQPGHLLSLEIQPLLANTQLQAWTLPVLSLPELLAGKGVGNATGITVNDRGEVELTGGNILPQETATTTIISGNLNTSGQTGGAVQVLGDKVGLMGGNINANGINGGGTVLIGGDYRGRGGLEGLKAPSNSSEYKPLNASHTFISSDSYVSANAGVNGDGGRVIVWADKTTQIYGKIDAHGGINSGNGGFVETSGLRFLDISTVPDVKAPMGVGGEWLIDPYDISIVAGNGFSNINPLFPPFESTADSATIGVDLITTALASGANVVVKTGLGGSQVGDISLNAPLDFKGTGTNALIFEAAGNININQPIKNSVAGTDFFYLVLNAGKNINISQSISGSLNLILNTDITQGNITSVNVNGAIATNGGNVNILGASSINANAPIDAGTVIANANHNITVNQPIANSVAGGSPLNLILNADVDGIGGGNVIVNTAIATNGGNVTLKGADLVLNNTIDTGRGNITLQPSTATSTIGLGNSATGAFNLDTTELTTRLNSSGTVMIGRSDGTGIVDIKTLDLSGKNYNLTLNGGTMNFGGQVTLADNKTAQFISTDRINTLSSTSVVIGGNGSVLLDAINQIGNGAFGSFDINVKNFAAQTSSGNLSITNTNLNPIISSVGEVNGISAGNGNILLTSSNPAALITLNQPLSAGGNGSIAMTGGTSISLNNTITSTGGNITFKTPVTIDSNTNITSNGGNIIFNDTVNGSHLLSVKAGTGTVNFNEAVGQVKPLDSLEVDANAIASLNDVNITANNNITTGNITTNNGNIGLNSIGGNIKVNSIDADSNNVSVTAPSGSVRALNTIPSTDISIKGSTVKIQSGVPAFTVGNSANNGTAGTITDGKSLISPTFVVPSGIYTQGNITIATPELPAPPPIPIQTPIAPPAPPIQTPTPTSTSLAVTNAIKPSFRASNSSIAISSKIALSNSISVSNRVAPSNNIFVLPKEEKKIINSTTRSSLENLFQAGKIAEALPAIDNLYTAEFEGYFKQQFSSNHPQSLAQIQSKLQAIAQTTGTKPVIIYTFARKEQLDLLLIAPTGKPIYKSVPSLKRSVLLQTVKEFKQQIGDPTKRRTTSYLPSSRQLYQWIITPLEPDLQKLGINTLVFSMDAGLRTLPIAALHDDKQFLIEKYNLSLIPSFSLLDTNYTDIKNLPVLAMGMSEFSDQMPLPAVPLEIFTITERLWQGKKLLNEAFTQENLKQQRQSNLFKIVHLATHAQFKPGQASNSYIQLWDRKLKLDEIRQLKLNDPPVELLVLSACRTALGDGQVELGWAGLAVQAGAKSALASLWYVKDAGTLALMSEFYNQLHKAPIKSEALRQAQIAMLRGEVRLENGQLQGTFGQVALPPKLTALGNLSLKHPFYWAGYTMIGSPW